MTAKERALPPAPSHLLSSDGDRIAKIHQRPYSSEKQRGQQYVIRADGGTVERSGTYKPSGRTPCMMLPAEDQRCRGPGHLCGGDQHPSFGVMLQSPLSGPYGEVDHVYEKPT